MGGGGAGYIGEMGGVEEEAYDRSRAVINLEC